MASLWRVVCAPSVQAKSVMVVEVTAPAWLHRFIIGKKGQNIGRITQQLPRVRTGQRSPNGGRGRPKETAVVVTRACF